MPSFAMILFHALASNTCFHYPAAELTALRRTLRGARIVVSVSFFSTPGCNLTHMDFFDPSLGLQIWVGHVSVMSQKEVCASMPCDPACNIRSTLSSELELKSYSCRCCCVTCYIIYGGMITVRYLKLKQNGSDTR